MKLNNTLYNILKWLCLIVLPAIGTLYYALAGIWGFPYGEQVVATITAICTFIGTIIGISTISYNKEVKK